MQNFAFPISYMQRNHWNSKFDFNNGSHWPDRPPSTVMRMELEIGALEARGEGVQKLSHDGRRHNGAATLP